MGFQREIDTENIPLLDLDADLDLNDKCPKDMWRVVICLFIVVLSILFYFIVISVMLPLLYKPPGHSPGHGPGPGPGPVVGPSSDREDFDSKRSSGNEFQRLSPVIVLLQGKLQGNISKSRDGRDYFNFFSIPYALPPVGERRFEPPQPPVKWEEEVRDSTKVRAHCIPETKLNAIYEGSEDCLHLHVMTPKLPSVDDPNPKLPVMVYIHGGKFTGERASRYNPKYFMDEDVVLVFVEFRLAAFGYLNTGDTIVPGNMALKDQVMALKWIQKNIEKFGGDRKRVVIFGNGSGGASVHAHLLSNMSTGLFSGAISQSGVAIGPAILSSQFMDPGSIARSLGDDLGCSTVSSKILVKCLKNIDVTKIASWQTETGISTWGLTKESVPENGDLSQVFIKETPMSLMKKGQVNKVPWIVGVNSRNFRVANKFLKGLNRTQVLNTNDSDSKLITKNISRLQYHPDLCLNLEFAKIDEVGERIKVFYFNSTYNDVTFKDNLTNLLSDLAWFHPARKAGMMHSKFSPVYFYYLNKERLSSNEDQDSYEHKFPASHDQRYADELQYLFQFEEFPEITKESQDYQFSKKLVRTWVSFAVNGAPNPDIDPRGAKKGKSESRWTPISKEQRGMTWFEISDESQQNIEPFTKRMEFWDSFPSSLLYGKETSNGK